MKVSTPKEGAIISGIVSAVAVRLAGGSPGCRPEVRSVSAVGGKHSRLDQTADVVVRCNSTARVILSVLSNTELMDVVGCDRRWAAFQNIPSVSEIVEFNSFDLAVHIFRRAEQSWSLETLSDPEKVLRLARVEMKIPRREFIAFCQAKTLISQGSSYVPWRI
jgi:hypothetical protein